MVKLLNLVLSTQFYQHEMFNADEFLKLQFKKRLNVDLMGRFVNLMYYICIYTRYLIISMPTCESLVLLYYVVSGIIHLAFVLILIAKYKHPGRIQFTQLVLLYHSSS